MNLANVHRAGGAERCDLALITAAFDHVIIPTPMAIVGTATELHITGHHDQVSGLQEPWSLREGREGGVRLKVRSGLARDQAVAPRAEERFAASGAVASAEQQVGGAGGVDHMALDAANKVLARPCGIPHQILAHGAGHLPGSHGVVQHGTHDDFGGGTDVRSRHGIAHGPPCHFIQLVLGARTGKQAGICLCVRT